MADTVMATFQVKAGMVDRLSLLLDKHFATISRLGLGSGPKPVRLVLEQPTGPILYEIFDWNEGAIGKAGENLEVKALWGEPVDRYEDEQRKGRFQVWEYGGNRSVRFDHKRRVIAVQR